MRDRIKYLVMDVDGTLTDGKIYMGENGEVFKAFNIKDGYGIHDIAISNGIMPIIITGRKSKILENRCRELGITEVHQGIQDKINTLKNILAQKKGHFREVAYIGDDLNDIVCMREIKNQGGVTGCPCNASQQIKMISEFVSIYNGGDGAVREFIDWILLSTE